MSNKVYDVLKQVAMVWLPAIATLYFAIANIWGLPYAEEIVGTITAIDAFLGTILGVANKQYIDGINRMLSDDYDASEIMAVLDKKGVGKNERS